MSNKNGNLLAFIVGAAVGAIAGVLLAPDSGANTRKKLKKTLGDLQEKGAEMVDEVEQNLRAKTHDLAGEAHDRVEAVKAAIQEGKAAYIREMKKS
jgi:gas vesicle protein